MLQNNGHDYLEYNFSYNLETSGFAGSVEKYRDINSEMNCFHWLYQFQILLRLNKKLTNSVPNLQDKIDKAMSMHIDKVDKDNYETLLKDWEEMDNTLDHGIAGLSSAQAGLKRTMEEDHDEFKSGLSDVKVRVTELKVSHDEMRCDLKKMTVSPGTMT